MDVVGAMGEDAGTMGEEGDARESMMTRWDVRVGDVRDACD